MWRIGTLRDSWRFFSRFMKNKVILGLGGIFDEKYHNTQSELWWQLWSNRHPYESFVGIYEEQHSSMFALDLSMGFPRCLLAWDGTQLIIPTTGCHSKRDLFTRLGRHTGMVLIYCVPSQTGRQRGNTMSKVTIEQRIWAHRLMDWYLLIMSEFHDILSLSVLICQIWQGLQEKP